MNKPMDTAVTAWRNGQNLEADGCYPWEVHAYRVGYVTRYDGRAITELTGDWAMCGAEDAEMDIERCGDDSVTIELA